VDGKGLGKVSGRHIPDVNVARMGSCAEEELGLVFLPEAAAFRLYVTVKAETVHRFRGQTEAVALMAILGVDIFGVAIGAVRNPGLMGVDDFFGACPEPRGQKNADEKSSQNEPDPAIHGHLVLRACP